MRWISSFDPKPRRVFVTHGEERVALTFAGRLKDELGLEADVPYNGEAWRCRRTPGWPKAAASAPSAVPTQSRPARRPGGRLRDEPQPMSPDRADAFAA
jgi:hypothetical protein